MKVKDLIEQVKQEILAEKVEAKKAELKERLLEIEEAQAVLQEAQRQFDMFIGEDV